MLNPVRQHALEQVRSIVFNRLAGHPARVYLFGSCARGDAQRWSDIDVAIEPLEPLPPGLQLEIEDDLAESTVPYFVDVVNLSTAGAAFRDEVEREGVEWTR